MKEITGYAKTYDWTGVDISKAYGYGYISLTLGDDVGTKLPVEDVTKLTINLFEPDDIITDILQKPLTPYKTGEVLTGVMGTNVTNSTVPAICEGDLTFFGQPLVNPYDDNFMLSNWEYPFAFKQPWGSGSANIPFYAGNLNGPTKSNVNYQRKKYFWDTGNTISDNIVAFNGKMLSPLQCTEENPLMLQYGDFIYYGPKGGSPEMSDDDVSEGDFTFTFGGRTLETTRWRHKSSPRIYFGNGWGNGPSIGFGWNLTSGPSWGITIYSDRDVSIGSLNQLPQVNTVYDDYLYITRVGDTNTQNIGALTSWALGVKYDDNGEIDDIYILVDQTDNVVNSANSHFIFWGSLKDEADTILGTSTITYAGFKYWLDNVYQVRDPYKDAGTSGPGGGGGSWDYSSDIIGVPSLPSDLAIHSGLITVYAPTPLEIIDFTNFMLGKDENSFYNLGSSLVKWLLANPMDVVISYCIMPFDVGRTDEVDAVKVANIPTTVKMHKTKSQYVEIDCGTVHVDKITGSYLDYDTQYDLYLPYVGNVPLRADDIVDKDLHVVYHADIVTGALACYIEVDGRVLYNYNGQCGQQLPLSATDYSNILNGIMGAATGIVGPVASANSAALQAMAVTSNPTSKPSEIRAAEGAESMANANVASAGMSGASSLITGGLKPNVQKSGALSGPGGMLNIQVPYLTITTPRICLPDNQGSYTGYPLFATRLLSDVSGFTTIDSIHLNNIPATNAEIGELQSLLAGGVIL